MKYSVWFIGALICAWGVAAAMKPNWMKRVVDFIAVGRRFWPAAAMKVVIGVLFLVVAQGCRLPWVIGIIGGLMAGGSLLAMTIDPASIQKLMQWEQKQPLWVYRAWGVLAVLFGGVLLYAG